VEGAAAERRSIAGRHRGVSGDRFHTRRQAQETGSIGAVARWPSRHGDGYVQAVEIGIHRSPCPGGKVAS
jgi:hypothetical protein